MSTCTAITTLQSSVHYLLSGHRPDWLTDWLALCPVTNLPTSEVEVELMTDSQSASLSWCRAPIWSPWPDIFCLTIASFLMWSALSDERTGVQFTVASGPRPCSPTRVWVQRDSRPNFFFPQFLSLPQPGGQGSRIYISQNQGSPVIPPGTEFPFHRPLRLVGIWWRCSIPPPHLQTRLTSERRESRVTLRPTVSQSVSQSVCGDCGQTLLQCCHGSLDNWTVLQMTAAKLKPFIFFVLGFALSNVENIFIFMILDDLYSLPAWFCYVIVKVCNLESHMHSSFSDSSHGVS
jgi:hypothetical protein